MSEPPVGGIPADVAASLSPETRQTFTDQMLNAGFSKEAIDKAFAAPLQRAPIDPAGRTFTSAADADSAAAAARSAQEARIRENVLEHTAPAPDADSYIINLAGNEYARRMDATDFVKFHSEITSAFSAAKIPANLAQPLADAFLNSAGQVSGLNEAQRRDFNTNQRSILARMQLGRDEIMRLAGVALSAMPEAIRTSLLKRGCLEAAPSVLMLANAALALEAREKLHRK